jgi:hypothetical protein
MLDQVSKPADMASLADRVAGSRLQVLRGAAIRRRSPIPRPSPSLFSTRADADHHHEGSELARAGRFVASAFQASTSNEGDVSPNR